MLDCRSISSSYGGADEVLLLEGATRIECGSYEEQVRRGFYDMPAISPHYGVENKEMQ